MPRQRRAASRDPQRRDECLLGEKDGDKVTYLDSGGGKAEKERRERKKNFDEVGAGERRWSAE